MSDDSRPFSKAEGMIGECGKKIEVALFNICRIKKGSYIGWVISGNIIYKGRIVTTDTYITNDNGLQRATSYIHNHSYGYKDFNLHETKYYRYVGTRKVLRIENSKEKLKKRNF